MSFKHALYATIAASVLLTGAAAARAEQVIITHQGHVDANGLSPKFALIRHVQTNIHGPRATGFPPTWTYSFTSTIGSTKTALSPAFIGTNPTGGASTTVPVYIIPFKLVSGSTSEDPTVVTQNGVSIIKNVTNSPIFSSTVDFKSGSIDLGTTQYLDAYQRANLWGAGVSSHTGYHVLLGTPTIEPVQTITLTKSTGSVKSPYGQSVIVANINTIDSKINSLISSLKIPANAFPMFIGVNNYLYSGSYNNGCCIGGYHSATSAGQPYMYSTYITVTGNFAQDIGALSHEVGEWIVDPSGSNPAPSACGSGSVLEVGDPLETEANFGDFNLTVGGVTWHPQDLVTLEYFGAPTTTSANGYSTFEGQTIAACSNGG